MMSRIAVVTGGTRGIGAAISKFLKQAGYTVVANYTANDQAAQTFQAETGIYAFKWDASDYEDCVKGIKNIHHRLGDVDVLVNNAGITRDAMFHKMSLDQWREVMAVNLDSVFNMTRAVIEGMRERNYGRIINISSINAQKGQMGQANYSAAKAGMIGFTKALALETARKGITVNAITPGYIATDMVANIREDVLEMIVNQIPVGRLGTPEEIARCVAFLAAEEAGFITGATFAANGGQYMA
jgi:acetoacetyl-CoA reductase